jgi:hypothetical protein
MKTRGYDPQMEMQTQCIHVVVHHNADIWSCDYSSCFREPAYSNSKASMMQMYIPIRLSMFRTDIRKLIQWCNHATLSSNIKLCMLDCGVLYDSVHHSYCRATYQTTLLIYIDTHSERVVNARSEFRFNWWIFYLVQHKHLINLVLSSIL